MIMTEIAKKKFEILSYTQSDEFTVDGLADKLNELTKLTEVVNKNDLSPRVMHRKSFLEERIAYTENKLKQNRNSEEVYSLEYDLYGFKQQLAAIEYVLYGA
jgi:hypothetical protein